MGRRDIQNGSKVMKQLVIPKGKESLLLFNIFVQLGKIGYVSTGKGNLPFIQALANARAYAIEFPKWGLPTFGESEIGVECGFFVQERWGAWKTPMLLREAIPWLNAILKEAELLDGFEIVLE
jgi:hypothetical protein